MKFLNVVTATAMAASLSSPAVWAADTLSPAQKTNIEKVVHDYLINHPEVLIEASQALQQKQQTEMQVQAQGAIVSNAKQLFDDKTTVLGNPKGNVTLVEFFDYQCIHCKKMSPIITKLIKDNSNLRVIFKEFPIFGKSSDLASRAALAAGLQGKYHAMHEALFKQNARLNEQIINNTAKSLGLDMAKFKADMTNQAVTDMLTANRQLAEKLRLMGTPAFIIASTPNGQLNTNDKPTFIPGAANLETLQDTIKKKVS